MSRVSSGSLNPYLTQGYKQHATWERIITAAPKQLLQGITRCRVYVTLERVVTAAPEKLLQAPHEVGVRGLGTH